MSIFKRREQADVQQTSSSGSVAQVGDSAQAATPMPAAVPPAPGARGAAPGVVPPPAAPIYSMRPPQESARFEGDAATSVAERVSMAREAQLRAQADVQERLRALTQRTRMAAAPAPGVRRRPVPQQAPASPRAVRTPDRHLFDPLRAAQTGLLNLAWSWQQAGAPIRAIHTYMELLSRYPDSAAADAAVSDLVELSEKLVEQGNFHTALGIYDELEQFQSCEDA